MNIVAIDVGETTGIAFQLGEFKETTTESTSEGVWQFVANNEWNVVIYENFATGGLISKHGLYTVRLIGGIQAICMLKSTKCVGQYPQYRKAFIEQADSILKKSGRHYVVHEKDALAHLLAYDYYTNMSKPKQSNTDYGVRRGT